MDKYNEIFAYLQEAVNNGTMTMKHAEELNDLAYNKYVVESEENITLEEVMEYVENYLTEANAYNKYIDKKKKQHDNHMTRSDAFKSLGSEAAIKKGDKEEMKAREIRNEVYHKTGGKELQFHDKKGTKDDKYAEDIRDYERGYKQHWMNKHGNEGIRPEEKYKANRYLNVQKTLKDTKESVDLLRLQVFEAAQAGDISLEDRDHLLSLLTVGV